MANQYRSDYAAERKAAEKVLMAGLATVNEIAQHYGLARQTVAVWARGLVGATSRAKRVAEALRAGAKVPSKTRTSRGQMR